MDSSALISSASVNPNSSGLLGARRSVERFSLEESSRWHRISIASASHHVGNVSNVSKRVTRG